MEKAKKKIKRRNLILCVCVESKALICQKMFTSLDKALKSFLGKR